MAKKKKKTVQKIRITGISFNIIIQLNGLFSFSHFLLPFKDVTPRSQALILDLVFKILFYTVATGPVSTCKNYVIEG